MFNAIILWLHILAAVIFIGPQTFLVAVAMPALRSIDDVKIRQSVTRAVTRGFGILGGGALVVLIVTGFINYATANDDGLIDFKRYFIALKIKLTRMAARNVTTVADLRADTQA